MIGHMTAADGAQALCEDIRRAYERLRVRGELTGSVRGVGVDDAVTPHIPTGMKLDAAETLLREAGFGLAPRAEQTGEVHASSDTVLPNTTAGVRREVVVILVPRGTGAAAEVGAVQARIVVTTL